MELLEMVFDAGSSQLNYSKYFKDDFSYQYYLRKCHVSRYLFTNYHSTYLWHSLKYLIGYRNWQRNVGIYPLEKLRFNEMFISQEMKNSFRLRAVKLNNTCRSELLSQFIYFSVISVGVIFLPKYNLVC